MLVQGASRSRVLVHATGAVAAVLAAGALAACSGSSGSSAASVASSTPPAATTTTSTATTTTTAPAGATPTSASSSGSGSGGSGGSAGVGACRESQLRAQIDPRPFGTVPKNDRAVIVQFINTSSTACSLHGYPGAAILDASNHPLVQATRTLRGQVLGLPRGVDTLPTVTLKPGAVASAGIEGVNKQKQGTAQAGCGVLYPRIVVTPPNTSTAVPFAVRWPACYSFTVHPTNIDETAN